LQPSAACAAVSSASLPCSAGSGRLIGKRLNMPESSSVFRLRLTPQVLEVADRFFLRAVSGSAAPLGANDYEPTQLDKLAFASVVSVNPILHASPSLRCLLSY
jgi:hypothetical protein